MTTRQTIHCLLARRLTRVLDGSLGLNIFSEQWTPLWRTGWRSRTYANAFLAGAQVSVIYFIVFCVPLILLERAAESENNGLLKLQIYDALWAGWATISTRLTSSSIQEIFIDNVIPALSEKAATQIYHSIRISFRRRVLTLTSWAIGSVGGIFSAFLIHLDLTPQIPFFEVAWWAFGWAILFTTSASVVNTSRIYLVFTKGIEAETERLYPIDPAQSTIIRDINAIARRMLLFWLGISLSIALIIPFALRPNPCKPNYENLAAFAKSLFKNAFVLDLAHNNFVVAEIAVTSIFSIGGGTGTLVFLLHEACIRRAVRNALRTTLGSIEALVAQPVLNLGQLDEDGRKRLKDLDDLHKSAVTGGSYRSLVISGLSLVLPFVPLISLLIGK